MICNMSRLYKWKELLQGTPARRTHSFTSRALVPAVHRKRGILVTTPWPAASSARRGSDAAEAPAGDSEELLSLIFVCVCVFYNHRDHIFNTVVP